MRSGYGQSQHRFFQGALTPAVKKILIANAAVFLLQIIGGSIGFQLEPIFGISGYFWNYGAIYQLFSYMWLHSTSHITHILFNMLIIWMFGRELEMVWGPRQFFRYYFVSGVGAGVVIVILDILLNAEGLTPITIGASGALYGLLLASALSWPNREVYLYFFIPVKMKWFVLAIGIISFMGLLGDGGNISHSGHLGGLLSGYLYIIYKRKGMASIFDLSKLFSIKEARKGEKKSSADSTQKGFRIYDFSKAQKRKQEGLDKPFTYRKPISPLSNLSEPEKRRRVDMLLDQISQSGLDSLSESEKQFLNDASRDYRSSRDD